MARSPPSGDDDARRTLFGETDGDHHDWTAARPDDDHSRARERVTSAMGTSRATSNTDGVDPRRGRRVFTDPHAQDHNIITGAAVDTHLPEYDRGYLVVCLASLFVVADLQRILFFCFGVFCFFLGGGGSPLVVLWVALTPIGSPPLFLFLFEPVFRRWHKRGR